MNKQILVGDCRQTLPTLPEKSVHCCVTSPPYFGLRDYGHADQIGLESTPDAYVANLVDVFREVRRVLRDDGTVWLNLGDSYASGKGTCFNPGGGESSLGKERKEAGVHPLDRGNKSTLAAVDLKPKDLIGIPWRVAFALQADGWYLRQDIIWHKPNPMPESVTDRCTKAHEYVFLLSKSARYWYDAEAVKEKSVDPDGSAKRYASPFFVGEKHESGGYSATGAKHTAGMKAYAGNRNRRSVWTVATAPYSGAHFATFPPALILPMILAGCPAKCCPACGAGWERVVEKTGGPPNNRFRDGLAGGCKTAHTEGTVAGSALSELYRKHGYPTLKTTGWRPTCRCTNPDQDGYSTPWLPPIPGTVLDPFGGSGTTAAVATGNGRNAILCELNPEYITLADERIGTPLFDLTTSEGVA